MWFESYLKNRSQYVSIKNNNSHKYSPKYGVPQGGTLAPILFIIYMNDIVHSSSIFEFSMYADDTCLSICADRCKYDEILQTEIEKVNEWFNCNELLLNIDKTDYLMFGPTYNKNYIKGEHDMSELHTAIPAYLTDIEHFNVDASTKNELNLNGEFLLNELHHITPKYLIQEHFQTSDGTITIENTSVKYLGIHIDRDLKFKKHINITCCKINRMVNTFWKCPIQNIDIKKQIYHALVESHLNYGILLYAANYSKNVVNSDVVRNYTPNNLKQLVITQNKILRAILQVAKYDKNQNKYNATSPLYKQLGVLKLEDLYRYNLGILCHNSLYNHNSPVSMKERFTLRKDVVNKNTRTDDMDLYYQTTKFSKTQQKPSLAGAIFWNSLPALIKNIKSNSRFKLELKIYLSKNY